MIINDNPSLKSSTSWDRSDFQVVTFLNREFSVSDLQRLEELYADLSDEDILESIKTDIRQNYQFSLFSIIPGLAPEFDSLKRAAKKLGIRDEHVREYTFRLLSAGLWKITDGKVETNFEHLSLGDISVKDYLSMTVSIVAHLSEAKSYQYEALSLITNRGLIRGFISKVNAALRELHDKSILSREDNDVLFSWTHTGVFELEMKKKAPRGAKEDLT